MTEAGSGKCPIPDLAAIMGRLGKPPRTVRLLNLHELREIEGRMDPQGLDPFHPQAQGLRVNVISLLGILFPGFLLCISLPSIPIIFTTDVTGIFWLNVLFRVAMAFIGLFLAWTAIFTIRAEQSYVFRAYFIFEPDRIRWRRDGCFYRRNACFSRSEILRVDLVSDSRALNVRLLLASGERIAPFRPFPSTAKGAWFAWFFHLALSRILTGNVPLLKLGENLSSGTISRRDTFENGDGALELAEGQPPAIVARGVRDADRISEYESGDPAVPSSIRRLLEEMADVCRPVSLVLVDRRDRRSAMRVFPMVVLLFIFLFILNPIEAANDSGGLRDCFALVLTHILLIAHTCLLFSFLLGRIWLTFSEGRLVRRRVWGWLRSTSTFDAHDAVATELVRQNRDGDKYDLFLRFGSGEKEELIGSLGAETAERLAGIVSLWTETPVLRRKSIMP